MANLKILLDIRRAKCNGTFNVIFRITNCRKVYTINSGISLESKFWNSQNSEVTKLHPNAKLINLKLNKDYFILQDAILRFDDDFSIEKLRNRLNGKELSNETSTFKVFADRIITQMFESNRVGNAIVYQTAVNRFLHFHNKKDLKFSEITYKLLEEFIFCLKMQGLKTNSISNYLRSLRAIYNRAIKENIIERSKYPFYDLKIKVEKTQKRAISKDDIFKLINIKTIEGSEQWKALNYFLLSYYFIGISFTDLAYLKHENILNGRVVFRRRKTRKLYDIKLFPQAKLILEIMRPHHNCPYLLPVLGDEVLEDSIIAKKIIQQWVKTTNLNLKKLAIKVGIKNNLTTYVSRHTFGTAAKKLGYSNELIAEALGHEYGNKTTNIYLDSFDKDVVDAMHYTVIS